MLMKIMVAVVGGTILSLIFGYLFAYWRELMNRQGHALKNESEWDARFDRMTSGKQGELAGAARRTSASQKTSSAQRSQSTSSRTTSWSSHPELKKILERSQDFYPDIHQYFLNLSELAEELGKLEVSEFRVYTSVSATFLMERMQELLEARFFDRFLFPEGSALMVRESWLSYSAAYLFCEDARLGSSSLSQSLELKHHLAPQDIYRGIEYAAQLSKGASRASLQQNYKNKIDQSFQRSQWLQEMTKEQRIQLVWSLAHDKGLHAHGIAGVVKAIEQAVLELEEVLLKSFEEKNRESNKQQQRKQQKKQKQKEPPPESEIPKKTPYQTEFEILQMPVCQDISAIKKQFKKMAMKYHPDRQGPQSSQERFVALQKAYETLDKAYGKKAA